MKKTAIIIAIMALIFQSCSFSPNPDDSGMQEGADNADVTMLRIANADGPAILFRPDTGEYLQYIPLEGGIPKPVVLSDNDGNTYMFSLCNLQVYRLFQPVKRVTCHPILYGYNVLHRFILFY